MVRIGKSTDIHRLVANRDLILGGVKIDSDLGLLGHSDADVLTHAIAEAILGALALGDLGHHFPDNDEKYENISSLIILKEVFKMMDNKGYRIGNVDSLIIIEKPKIAPYIETIRKNIADVLETSIDNISIKATCGESLGYVGSREGAIAEAVVLIENK